MSKKPIASRPYMPEYGILDEKSGKGLLPWAWAQQRLSKTPYYWVSTVRPDGRPHAMVVWGIWLKDVLYFSTGRKSRKAKNLAANPRCAISVLVGDDAVIVEGTASEIRAESRIKPLSKVYKEKYGMALDANLGPVYAVNPSVVFGFIGASHEDNVTGDFVGASTRWRFS
jgi:nitroimidazol reductase NimA-like FMN-containing flavoprotein (pyridoxamine 5'-phosphate oxidase superfamily)